MHELSVAEAILEVVLRHAGGAQVRTVRLRVGELSSYVDDSIALFWAELTRGTQAEGARIEFTHEPGTLVCLDCSAEFGVDAPDFVCPLCASRRALPRGGRECYVDSIEVEGER